MGEMEIKWAIEEQADLISALAEKAGITEAVKHARETGAPEKLRDAYYSVRDADLRKQLITITGKLDQLYLDKCDLDVSAARARVEKAIDKYKRHPWHLSVAASLGMVVIANWIFGLFGAIAGALIGYYLGEWAISVVKKENFQAIEREKHSLMAAQKRNEESKVDPYLFSASEQQGGERER
jgi:hypothetical protein